MNYLQLRAIILANPTEPPTSIAERIDVPAWKVKDARKGLIHAGLVARLAKTAGPINDADSAAIIEMRRAGHTITEITEHFHRAYSVVFRIIAQATRAGCLEPAKRIDAIRPARVTKSAGRISGAERAVVIALRKAGKTYPQIAAATGRSVGCLTEIIQSAIADGALEHVKRMPLTEPQIEVAEIVGSPAPAPRVRKPKEPPCRWALSLMARGMSEVQAREQARLDRHKRNMPA
jgi:transposase